MQGSVPDAQLAAVPQEAAYSSLAPTGPDRTPIGPDSTPTGPDSTPIGPDSTPNGPDSTPTRHSNADDPVLDTIACSQSDASVSTPPDGPAASAAPRTTAAGLGMGSEQDSDGAKSNSRSVEPQTSDAAAGPSSNGTTVGMTPGGDGGDGVGPSALGASVDSEVTDLTGHSDGFAQVRLHMLACGASSRWL